jgi:hypothetical protein
MCVLSTAIDLAVAGAKDLTLCLDGQQGEQRSVVAIAEVDRSAGFGQPQLDAVSDAPGVEGGEPVGGEGAFVLADHDRIDGGLRGGDRGQQLRGAGRAGWPYNALCIDA